MPIDRQRRFALALVTGLLAGAPGALPAEAAEPLTYAEIWVKIIGNTVSGDMGAPFEEYYRGDGAILGASPEGRYEGKWTIDDDKLCLEYAEPFGCFEITLDGDKVSYRDDDLGAEGTGTLLPGNPNGF